jgi:drug/metabolite transporter (DMT)-like permease
LYTSMKSFVYSGVSTILVLRNVGAIVTTVVEYFVRGTKANAATYASEVVIVIGAILYTGGAVDATPTGLFWIFFNVICQVMYGVLLKHKMETVPMIKELTNFSMSFYNNSLSIPMVFIVLLLQEEHHVAPEMIATATNTTWSLILLTCIFGFIISTSGFALQKLVSAATFLVINNLTKFVNILIGVYILHDRVVGWNGIGGCLLALGGGVWYSYEQMKLRAAANNSGVKK